MFTKILFKILNFLYREAFVDLLLYFDSENSISISKNVSTGFFLC